MKTKSLLLLYCVLSVLNINAEVYEGSCGADGDNVKYSLDTNTGVLLIYGEGKMQDYDIITPWFSQKSYIKTVEFEDGITSIGSRVFYQCYSLTSVTIPRSVVSIGGYAFYQCTGLSSVNIIDIVAWCKIDFSGNDANPLYYAKYLSKNDKEIIDLVIPDYVTSISDYAFSGCSGLVSITIPNSVISIGASAFSGCYFEKQNFINNSTLDALANKYWGGNIVEKRENDCIINKGVLTKYCGNHKSVVIPNGVSSIGDYAFAMCWNMESVTIPNTITSIGKYSFEFCSQLSSIIIPDNVKHIGYDAFYYCKNLNTVTIGKGVKEIGSNAFGGCDNLKKVVINDLDAWCRVNFGNTDSNNSNPLKYAHRLYLGNEEIEYLEIPSTIYYINSYAFYGLTGLKSVKIPNSVRRVGHEAFNGCYNLEKVIVPDLANWCNIDFSSKYSNPLFYAKHLYYDENTEITSLVIPNNVTSIGNNAFSGCSNLISITIPNSVTSIGESAFLGCANIKELTIPNSIQCIRSSTFEGCTSLSKIFFGYSILEIGSLAFSGCNNLKDIYVKSSNPPDFNETNFNQYGASIYVPNDNISNYKNHSVWGKFSAIKEYPTATLIIDAEITEVDADYVDNTPFLISKVIIPCSIKRIKTNAFHNIGSLKEVIIECSTEELDFEEGGNFYGSPLNIVYIGRKMIYSRNSPFKNNKEGLKTLKFGEPVTEISDEEFSGFVGLTSVELPQNLKTIGTMAFYGCEGLTELTIPGSVTEIGQQAFDLCNHLKTLRLDDGKELLKFTAEPNYLNNAFQNSPLEEVYIGRDFSFNNSSPLAIFETMKSLTFGEEVLSIQARSFIGCPNLKDVTSYSKVVPITNDIVFTPSYQTNATLHVPYALYDEYKVANVWKDFGKIVNFEGLYNLVYSVDGEEYKKYVVEQGTSITPEAEPTKEGYIFSGWSELPTTMPAEDVIVTGTFTIDTTGIENVYSNDNNDGNKEYYNLNGIRIAQPKKGFNIVKMSDGSIKKIFIK